MGFSFFLSPLRSLSACAAQVCLAAAIALFSHCFEQTMQQQQQSLRALKARARSPFCLRIAANAHRPIINMILYDSFQYTSIVVMLR